MGIEVPSAGDGGVPPADDVGMPPADDGGVSPMAIARAFGTRTQSHLCGLSIVHNLGHRGWWFAVQVSELRSCDYIATGVDAHVTLFYLRSHHERVADVAEALSAALERILTRRGGRRLVPRLPVDFNTAGRVSDSSWPASRSICPAVVFAASRQRRKRWRSTRSGPRHTARRSRRSSSGATRQHPLLD